MKRFGEAPLQARVEATHALVLAIGAAMVRTSADPAATWKALNDAMADTRSVVSISTAEAAWKEMDSALRSIRALADDVMPTGDT